MPFIAGASGASMASDASVRSSRKESEATPVSTSDPDPSEPDAAAERTARRGVTELGRRETMLNFGKRVDVWSVALVGAPLVLVGTTGRRRAGEKALNDVARDIDALYATVRVVGA